jgi:hypothetical protein
MAPEARLLKYVGADPEVIDPMWDFEPRGELDGALRLFRTRVFAPGRPGATRRARVRLLRQVEGEEKACLDPREHVFLHRGGADLEAASYLRLTSDEVEVRGPSVALAVDLSRLPPCALTLEIEVPDAAKIGADLAFRVVRRPIYGFDPEPDGAPRARCVSGLADVDEQGKRVAAAAHAWRVLERSWTASAYDRTEARTLAAVTLFTASLRPEATRWQMLQGAENEDPLRPFRREAFEAWRVPGEHAPGLGLAFPRLVGLPRQPAPDGSFPPERVARAP